MKDVTNLRAVPITSFALFTLGVIAAYDFGPHFVAAIGVTFMASTVVWIIEKQRIRRESTASTGEHQGLVG